MTNLGKPVDPAYTAFESGITAAVAELGNRWRWCPKDNKWYTYAQSKWIMDDAGLGETDMKGGDPELSLEGYKPARPAMMQLSQTFDALNTRYEALKTDWPNAVWAPFTGQWFDARQRTSTPPPPPPVDEDCEEHLSPKCCEQIQTVKDLIEAGTVTRELGDSIIKDIVQGCI